MDTSVAILGSGNMADFLLRAFHGAGIHIEALIARDLDAVRKNLPSSTFSDKLLDSSNLKELKSHMLFLAISDDAIAEVTKNYTFKDNQCVIHTSGAVNLHEIQHSNKGVFYPLQTLTSGRSLDFSQVPLLIESSDKTSEQVLLSLGKKISTKVLAVNSSQRLRYHLAAVFVSNFVNHLYHSAQGILQKNNLPLDLLFPLMQESLDKAREIGPWKAQTGPALRNDEVTLNAHREILKEDDLKAIYNLMTEQIQNRQKWD